MAVDVGTKTGQTNDDTDDGNQVADDAFTQVIFVFWFIILYFNSLSASQIRFALVGRLPHH